MTDSHCNLHNTASRVHTHSLHGEQLYLIILAFEKFLNILEDGNGSLQITCGSLANYNTTTAHYRNQWRTQNPTEMPLKPQSTTVSTSGQIGIVALGPTRLHLQSLKGPVGFPVVQFDHAAPT